MKISNETKLFTRLTIYLAVAILAMQAIAILIAIALPKIINADSTVVMALGILAVAVLFVTACAVLLKTVRKMMLTVADHIATNNSNQGGNHE